MNADLSPLESIMWRAGQDPSRRLTIGALLLLDAAPDDAELVKRVAEMVGRDPRLLWLPDDPTFSRIRPLWVEEVIPDAEHHVRSVDVGPPGSLRQVLDLVGLLEAVPFDHERSPWDVTLLRGLADGGAALYLRAHHVLVDGVGGAQLVAGLCDHPEPPKFAAGPAAKRRRLRSAPAEDNGVEPGAERRLGTVTIDLTKPFRSWSSGVEAAREVRPVNAVLRGVQRGLDLANSVSRQVMVTGGPLSPVPPSHSMLSHIDTVSVHGAREAAVALGGSRNDLLVVAAAAAVGLYYERAGKSCPNVRVGFPVRQQRHGDISDNWFAPTRVEVPAAPDHPERHFGIVAERLAQARHEPALRITSALASAISRLPNRVLLPALHAQADSIDLSVTAVPGLHGTPRLCGANVKAAYPLGPRLGIPLNITAFANGADLDVGIALDAAAITNPDLFRECLVEMFARLVPVGAPA